MQPRPSLGVLLELLVQRLSFSGRIVELVGVSAELLLPVPESLPEKEATFAGLDLVMPEGIYP